MDVEGRTSILASQPESSKHAAIEKGAGLSNLGNTCFLNSVLNASCTLCLFLIVFCWIITQRVVSDKIYADNIEASVAALRKLEEEWKNFSSKKSSLQALTETLKSFRQKNEKALSDDTHQAFFKDADKYCKIILGRLSSGCGCMKTMAVLLVCC